MAEAVACARAYAAAHGERISPGEAVPLEQWVTYGGDDVRRAA